MEPNNHMIHGQQVIHDIGNIHNRQDQEAAHHRMLLDWISSTDYHTQQSDNIQRRQYGTCRWFLHAPQVQQWLKESGFPLFCPGIIGAGKTIMAATMVDHLLKNVENDRIGVAYVYCNNGAHEEQSASGILAAILKQLVTSHPSCSEPLTRLYELHNYRRTRPDLENIFWTLAVVIDRFHTVFIIIDALDQCQNSDGSRELLLRQLRDLQRRHDVRLLVTSRFVPDVVDEFKNALRLEIRANAEDIANFVLVQMDRLPVGVQNDPEIQYLLRDKIVQAADGMYVYRQVSGYAYTNGKPGFLSLGCTWSRCKSKVH
jgi:hypothetical protein